MAKVTYKLINFNSVAAENGALCIVLDKSKFTGGHPKEGDTVSNTFLPSPDSDPGGYIGTGICRRNHINGFDIYINSTLYQFSTIGEPVSTNAKPTQDGFVIFLAEIYYSEEAPAPITVTGDVVISATTSTTTRTVHPDGSITYDTSADTEHGSTVIVDDLKARDQFAVQALQAMMGTIADPSVSNDAVISNYCNAAYRWAAGMMSAAAGARAKTKDEVEGDDPSDPTNVPTASAVVVDPQMLSNNTEMLLNNIVAALEKTDKKEKEIIEVLDGEPVVAQVFAERVSIPKLIDWLNAYSKHTPVDESDEKTTVGLDDLIEAIKSLKEEGGGGGDDASNIIIKPEVYNTYTTVEQATNDGWEWDNNVWSKAGYAPIAGAKTDDVAKTLPTYKSYQKVSIVELPEVITELKGIKTELHNICTALSNS